MTNNLDRAASDLSDLYELGRQLMEKGQLADAETAFKTCLKFNSENFEIRRHLAFCHLRQNQLTAALDELVILLKRDHKDLLSRLLMGRLCLRLNNLADAATHFQVILDAHPQSETGLSGMVDVALASDDAPKALHIAMKISSLYPDSKLSFFALANSYEATGDLEAAHQCLLQNLTHHPGDPSSRYHLGRILLKLGHLETGWLELHQVYGAGILPRPVVSSLSWDGQPTSHLLVIGDQGLGDTIQFARYLREARARAGYLTLACHSSLVPFISKALNITVIALDQVPGVVHDAHSTITDLPMAIGSLEDPYQLSALNDFYAYPASATVPQWVHQLGSLKIGISLTCSKVHSTEQFPHTRRSCTPLDALPLLNIPGAHFFHLQTIDDPEAQRLFGDRWHETSEGLSDFDDTVGWIRAMDVVVCVDSSLVHVAGSIGKQTCLALPITADWRWQLDSKTNPWYPQVNLYRQVQAGQWRPVFEAIAKTLIEKLTGCNG